MNIKIGSASTTSAIIFDSSSMRGICALKMQVGLIAGFVGLVLIGASVLWQSLTPMITGPRRTKRNYRNGVCEFVLWLRMLRTPPKQAKN